MFALNPQDLSFETAEVGLKLKFGFVKVRYRGLAKNANRLFAAFALVNLFLVRRKLLSAAA
jgi:IS5 family transposase